MGLVPVVWGYGSSGSPTGILRGVGLLAVTLGGACPGLTTGIQELRKGTGVHGIIVLRIDRPSAKKLAHWPS